jgi:hypothetical protein
MHRTLLLAGLALALSPAALANGRPDDPNARLVACYDEVTVPAKYHVEKVLVEPAKRKYVRKGGRVELWEYPAVYREKKTLIEESYVLMKQVPCDD